MKPNILKVFKFIEDKTGKKLNSGQSFRLKLLYDPSSLTKEDLDVEEDVNLSNTQIQSLPNDLVAHKIILTQFPRTYPKHLEDSISLNGSVTLGDIKRFTEIPEIVINLGKKIKRGKGTVVDFGTYSGSELKNLEAVAEYFNIAWTKVAVFKTMNKYNGEIINLEVIAKGTDNKNRGILYVRNLGSTGHKVRLISTEGQYTVPVGYVYYTPSRKKEELSKLFPKSEKGRHPTKVVNIRDLLSNILITRPVYWKIGRKVRGGENVVKGRAVDLLGSLSSMTRDRIEATGREFDVTWEDMIVFTNSYAINLVVHGKTGGGESIYYDKAEYGAKTFVGPKYIETTESTR